MDREKTARGTNFTCFHAGPMEGWTQYLVEPPEVPRPARGKLFLRSLLGSAGLEMSLNVVQPDKAIRTALIWSLRPRSEGKQNRTMDELWGDLAGSDAAVSYRSLWELADRPEVSVDFLQGKLAPARPVDGAGLRKWGRKGVRTLCWSTNKGS